VEIGKVELKDNRMTMPGDFVFILLDRAKVTFATKDLLLPLIRAANDVVSGDADDLISKRTSALEKFESVIRTVFKGTQQQAREHAQYYRVHVQQAEDTRGSKDNFFNKRRVVAGNTLSYWLEPTFPSCVPLATGF
jgi:chromosome condensin MukBEF ATPase and DNA-binding subunit MukB